MTAKSIFQSVSHSVTIGIGELKYVWIGAPRTHFKTHSRCNRLQISWICGFLSWFYNHVDPGLYRVGEKASQRASARFRGLFTSSLAHELFARSRSESSFEMGSRHSTDSVEAFLQGGTGIYSENQIRQLVNNAYAELRIHRMEEHLVAHMQKSLYEVSPILKRVLRKLVENGDLEDIPEDPPRVILQHIKRYRMIHTHKTTFGAYIVEGTLYVERPYLGLHMREEILFHELLEACGVSHFQTVKLTQEYLWDALLPEKEYVAADTHRIPDEGDDADAVIDEVYTPREAAIESAMADIEAAQKDIKTGSAYDLPVQSNKAQEFFHNKFERFNRAVQKAKYQKGNFVDLRDLSSDVEIYVIGDVHACWDNVEFILRHRAQYISGTTIGIDGFPLSVLDKVQRGEAVLFFNGDVVHYDIHSEYTLVQQDRIVNNKGTAKAFLRKKKAQLMRKLADMKATMTLLDLVMDLKIENPDHVYWILGNHDDCVYRGAVKWGIYQHSLYWLALKERFGPYWGYHYIRFVDHCPLGLICDGMYAFHGGFPKERLADYEQCTKSDPAVKEFIGKGYRNRQFDEEITHFIEAEGIFFSLILLSHMPALLKKEEYWAWLHSNSVCLIYGAKIYTGYAIFKNRSSLVFENVTDQSGVELTPPKDFAIPTIEIEGCWDRLRVYIHNLRLGHYRDYTLYKDVSFVTRLQKEELIRVSMREMSAPVEETDETEAYELPRQSWLSARKEDVRSLQDAAKVVLYDTVIALISGICFLGRKSLGLAGFIGRLISPIIELLRLLKRVLSPIMRFIGIIAHPFIRVAGYLIRRVGKVIKGMDRSFTSIYDQYRKWGLSDRMIVCLTGMEEGFFSGIWIYLVNKSIKSVLRMNPLIGIILDLLGNVIPFLLLHRQRQFYRRGHIWRIAPDDTKWEKFRDYAWLIGLRVFLNLIFILMHHFLPLSMSCFLGLPILWILHSAINFLGLPMLMVSGKTEGGGLRRELKGS
ncbi:metallophosphoesterase [Planctomycetota bacterium]